MTSATETPAEPSSPQVPKGAVGLPHEEFPLESARITQTRRLQYGKAMLVACMMGVSFMGCAEENSRWEAAQAESMEDGGVAVSEAALEGSSLNEYFPAQTDEIDLVFKQEKDGFAQAALRRNDEQIAMLSISDTRNNPEAREKYEDTAEQVAGYPAYLSGNTTSILVGDRFQVQIRSEGSALSSSDRAKWFEEFDLGGLEKAF